MCLCHWHSIGAGYIVQDIVEVGKLILCLVHTSTMFLWPIKLLSEMILISSNNIILPCEAAGGVGEEVGFCWQGRFNHFCI